MNSDVKIAVEAKGLVREYRRGAERIRALKGIDLAIAAGEFAGLVGHSGAGKTTFLNLAGLMDRPTEGSLTVLGHDVGRRGTGLDALRRKNIGFVFQEFYLMPTLTALENVLLPTMWGYQSTDAMQNADCKGQNADLKSATCNLQSAIPATPA